jgi:hypothetical protein
MNDLPDGKSRIFIWKQAMKPLVYSIYLFSAPYKIGFVSKRRFWLVGGDFCRNSRKFQLAFGDPNRNQHKKLRNSCAGHGKRLKNRSLNPKIGVAENRYIVDGENKSVCLSTPNPMNQFGSSQNIPTYTCPSSLRQVQGKLSSFIFHPFDWLRASL